jgi:hypothetical protein
MLICQDSFKLSKILPIKIMEQEKDLGGRRTRGETRQVRFCSAYYEK